LEGAFVRSDIDGLVRRVLAEVQQARELQPFLQVPDVDAIAIRD
jgi:hypothetical protein